MDEVEGCIDELEDSIDELEVCIDELQEFVVAYTVTYPLLTTVAVIAGIEKI